jgi:hypothetical protein
MLQVVENCQWILNLNDLWGRTEICQVNRLHDSQALCNLTSTMFNNCGTHTMCLYCEATESTMAEFSHDMQTYEYTGVQRKLYRIVIATLRVRPLYACGNWTESQVNPWTCLNVMAESLLTLLGNEKRPSNPDQSVTSRYMHQLPRFIWEGH